MKERKLIGGSHDGRMVKLYWWVSSLYLPKRISMQESAELQIDEVTGWRHPEELYEKNDAEDFVYKHTVHYKPTGNGKVTVDT